MLVTASGRRGNAAAVGAGGRAGEILPAGAAVFAARLGDFQAGGLEQGRSSLDRAAAGVSAGVCAWPRSGVPLKYRRLW